MNLKTEGSVAAAGSGQHLNDSAEKITAEAQDGDVSGRSIQNVGALERDACILFGVGLMAFALSRVNTRIWLTAAASLGLLYRGKSGYCPVYQHLKLYAPNQNPNTVIPSQHGVKVEITIAIRRPPSEVFQFWRNVENLPTVLKHLQSVQKIDQVRSRWVATGPIRPIQWDAEIFNEEENRLIAWRSVPGGDIDTTGSVRFKGEADSQETELTVSMKYNPLGGQIADYIASWFGADLESRIKSDLKDLKSYLESQKN